MKKITYITESSGFGGAENYLLYLVAGLRNRAEVSVALPFRECNEKFRALLGEAGAEVIHVPQFKALYPLDLIIALLFFARRENALFHFSLPYPDSCRWLLLAAALLRKRYLITEHLVPPDPFRAGVYFAVTHFLFNPLKKVSYELAQRVITVSGAIRDILADNYGLPREKMTVIHNGIDCAAYATEALTAARLRSELDIPEGSLVLTNVGRLAAQKGQKHLIAALEILAREELPLVLLLVGDGPLRGALEEEAERRGVAGMVRFAGFRNDVPAVLGITDIFVLASLNEGFPLTLLEAMAAGRAVVATRVTGANEAIVDRETGLSCAPASPAELAEKILFLLQDREMRIAMGERAREAVRKEFNLTTMVQRTFGLYEEVSSCAGR
jgi:glycosyltransferase involved in cell wall biosynthesis